MGRRWPGVCLLRRGCLPIELHRVYVCFMVMFTDLWSGLFQCLEFGHGVRWDLFVAK